MSHRRFAMDTSGGDSILSRAKLLNVSSAKYGGDWHSVPHTHNYAELFYTVGGSGQFRIGDKLYPVHQNQLVIISPNIIHTEVSYKVSPLEYIVLGIEGLELSVDDNNDGRFCIIDCPGGGEIVSCLRNIYRETVDQKPGYELICQAYMEILISHLMRSTSFAPAPEPAPSQVSRHCAAVRHYIDAHYKEPLNLDMLASQAHVSKYYLAHAFKAEYGISPINYQIYLRIKESRYLLRETDMSLSQISRILGFSSASYFSQSFRKAEGVSPLEFRNGAGGPTQGRKSG